MLASDIVVASEDCRFCQLEPKRGLAVFGGAHVRYVQRAGWGNAMYHLLRADEFDATRAKDLGFVQEVVPVGYQVSRALEIAGNMRMLSTGIKGDKKSSASVFGGWGGCGIQRDTDNETDDPRFRRCQGGHEVFYRPQKAEL